MSRKHGNREKVATVKKAISLVDVTYPVYGQYHALRDSINNIPNALDGLPFKMFLVDDASKDYEETGKPFYQEIKSKPFSITALHLNQNSGFARASNTAINSGGSEFILAMTTDVLLTVGSVRLMIEHMQHNPNLGIVAPKLLFFPNSNTLDRPAGKVQSVGFFFDNMGNPYHAFSGWDADHVLVNVVRDLNAVTGACFIIRRKVWNKIGGFSTDYGKGTYEDIDLCFRVKIAGYDIRILPQAVGYHYANLSILGAGEGFPIEQNANILKAKFGGQMPYDSWLQSGFFHE